ncbi:hypothetical protein GCHA_2746 [Paraglaciecola chathamensis S18K6]|uniref:Uncharacterized protein n=2 Tax=Paraglaciecola chathamensis TaxID=368405 RepID=A0ABQ0I9W0_9ALTE|nr:hypothetical protein GAGA_3307 [Paraglaciecola agarilytica NO2]GAC10689.1 hypothetical protein GCHA_2746 [Paraglaciecola chathamensis S18K6]
MSRDNISSPRGPLHLLDKSRLAACALAYQECIFSTDT